MFQRSRSIHNGFNPVVKLSPANGIVSMTNENEAHSPAPAQGVVYGRPVEATLRDHGDRIREERMDDLIEQEGLEDPKLSADE